MLLIKMVHSMLCVFDCNKKGEKGIVTEMQPSPEGLMSNKEQTHLITGPVLLPSAKDRKMKEDKSAEPRGLVGHH